MKIWSGRMKFDYRVWKTKWRLHSKDYSKVWDWIDKLNPFKNQ